MLQCALNLGRYASRLSPLDFQFLSLCKAVNDHFYMPDTTVFLTTLVSYEMIDVRLRNDFKRFLGRGHVTDDAITLNFL